MKSLKKLFWKHVSIDTSKHMSRGVAVLGTFTVNVSVKYIKTGRAIRSADCWVREKVEEVDAEPDLMANGLDGEVFIGGKTIR